MFTGFKLETDEMFSAYKSIGEAIFKENEREIGIEIKEFISGDGSINGSEVQDNWFPEVKADIFLSHSHKDRDKALGLAGFLSDKFGLKVFIDSCVWGYANNLLKQIDDMYSKSDRSVNYDYEKRNYSTSHVYAMLTTALVKMMHNTECLFFLNTSNSMITKDNIHAETISPWIYIEIGMSNMIEKVKPVRKRISIGKTFMQDNYSGLTIRYDLKTEHLTSMTQEHIETWLCIYNSGNSLIQQHGMYRFNALDILYKEYNLISISVDKRSRSIERKMVWKKIQNIWKKKIRK